KRRILVKSVVSLQLFACNCLFKRNKLLTTEAREKEAKVCDAHFCAAKSRTRHAQPAALPRAKKKRNPLGLRQLPPKEEDGKEPSEHVLTGELWCKEGRYARVFCAVQLNDVNTSFQGGDVASLHLGLTW